jgi:hypothetical protein
MFFGSTPTALAKFNSLFPRLWFSAFAMAKSLSRESMPKIKVTSSGGTLISAVPVTEITRGWLKVSCARTEGASVTQNASSPTAWGNFTFISGVSLEETRRKRTAGLSVASQKLS